MILQAKNISKWFNQAENKTEVLQDVNFKLYLGEMLYIVGPSGSGKTTLLSILAGILLPSGGHVIFKDKLIWQMNEDQLADFRLNYIGFVFQDFHLFPKLTAEENVALPLVLQRKPWSEALQTARELLTRFGLKSKINITPTKLSIGEKQRIAIARAIITKPQVLIFDEPTASLDGTTGDKIISLIKSTLLNEYRAIIIVTHDHRIYKYATRIIQLQDGKILKEESQ